MCNQISKISNIVIDILRTKLYPCITSNVPFEITKGLMHSFLHKYIRCIKIICIDVKLLTPLN